MTLISNSIFNQPINAILPIYSNTGQNSCNIIYTNGDVIEYPATVIQVIKQLCRTFRSDFTAQLMWSNSIINESHLSPIVLNEDLVLLPVKYRFPIGRQDGAHGYVRLGSILDVESSNLLITNNYSIPYISSKKTLLKKIQTAKLLKYVHMEEMANQRSIYSSNY